MWFRIQSLLISMLLTLRRETVDTNATRVIDSSQGGEHKTGRGRVV